jgi:hypothetical protein
MLRKLVSQAGGLLISFSGPVETDINKTSGTLRYNDAKCGVNGSLPNATQNFPPHPWPGQISETLGDPYTKVISGSRTMLWVINDAGAPVPARESSDGGASRIPAIPGLPANAGLPDGTSASPLFPWLSMSKPFPDAVGERPIIRMEISWNLVFGGV